MKRKMSKKILVKNTLVTVGFMTGATALAGIFFYLYKNPTNVAIIYMLAVALTAKFTERYVPGIIASFIGVICVNYCFTYPYMELNFTLDGYPVTFVGMMVISSITSTLTANLKLQSRMLHEREKRLMEAEKETMRANLLRAVSHDLRTPLTGMIGMANTYLDNQESLREDEKARLVEGISEDANWLLNMVENLLAVTRIRESGAKVNKSMESLEEVASEAVQRFRKRMAATGGAQALVRVKVPDEFAMVPMDAMLIEQVIINLLENAVYHSQTTAPVDFFVDLEGDWAQFHVRDYGKGICEEKLSTFFDGGAEEQGVGSDYHKGMGIGLTICKSIIMAHDGQIWAMNHPNGAEVVFSLPLKPEKGDRDAYA